MKEKEDELLALRGKLQQSIALCAEKDKIIAKDSKLIMQMSKKLQRSMALCAEKSKTEACDLKLIMQLSKKLEYLLGIIDEDLSDNNLVQVECKLKRTVSWC